MLLTDLCFYIELETYADLLSLNILHSIANISHSCAKHVKKTVFSSNTMFRSVCKQCHPCTLGYSKPIPIVLHRNGSLLLCYNSNDCKRKHMDELKAQRKHCNPEKSLVVFLSEIRCCCAHLLNSCLVPLLLSKGSRIMASCPKLVPDKSAALAQTIFIAAIYKAAANWLSIKLMYSLAHVPFNSSVIPLKNWKLLLSIYMLVSEVCHGTVIFQLHFQASHELNGSCRENKIQ